MKNSKKAFSLIEMIFAIVIIGIVASVAIPKLFETKDEALAVNIKQDVTTFVNAIQGHYMLKNSEVAKITDVMSLNNSIWEIEDKSITFKEKNEVCLQAVLNSYELEVNINKDVGTICTKLFEKGVESIKYSLN